MAYTRVNWADSPSTATPVDSANLNVMDAGIATLDTGKLGVTAQAADSAKLGGVAAASFPQRGSHNGVTYTVSAGNGAPAALAANEIYIQLS